MLNPMVAIPACIWHTHCCPNAAAVVRMALHDTPAATPPSTPGPQSSDFQGLQNRECIVGNRCRWPQNISIHCNAWSVQWSCCSVVAKPRYGAEIGAKIAGASLKQWRPTSLVFWCCTRVRRTVFRQLVPHAWLTATVSAVLQPGGVSAGANI